MGVVGMRLDASSRLADSFGGRAGKFWKKGDEESNRAYIKMRVVG